MGYPSAEEEREILTQRAARGVDEVQLNPQISAEQLLDSQRAIEDVHVDAGVTAYMVDLVAATRSHSGVQIGASPRGTLALLKLARARAALHHRDFVTPDDVKQVAVPALAHRLVLRPEMWIQRTRTEDVVEDCLREVPVPAVQPPGGGGETPGRAPAAASAGEPEDGRYHHQRR